MPPFLPAAVIPVATAAFAEIVTVPLAAERILPMELVTVMFPPAPDKDAPPRPDVVIEAKVMSPMLFASVCAPLLSAASVPVVMLTAPPVAPAAPVVVIEVPVAIVKAA